MIQNVFNPKSQINKWKSKYKNENKVQVEKTDKTKKNKYKRKSCLNLRM